MDEKVEALRKWIAEGRSLLDGFQTTDKYLARSVQNISAHMGKIEAELQPQTYEAEFKGRKTRVTIPRD